MHPAITQGQCETLGLLHSRQVFPDDYVVLELDTSGLLPGEDLITEAGWLVVERRRVVDVKFMVLDWTHHPLVRQDLLEAKLTSVAAEMLQQGKVYQVPIERMRTGLDAQTGLGMLQYLLSTWLFGRKLIVGHGIWTFDRPIIDSHMEVFLNLELPWLQNSVFDTGLVEKGSKVSNPERQETLSMWFDRIAVSQDQGIYWSLDSCIDKYLLPPPAVWGVLERCRAIQQLFEIFRG